LASLMKRWAPAISADELGRGQGPVPGLGEQVRRDPGDEVRDLGLERVDGDGQLAQAAPDARSARETVGRRAWRRDGGIRRVHAEAEPAERLLRLLAPPPRRPGPRRGFAFGELVDRVAGEVDGMSALKTAVGRRFVMAVYTREARRFKPGLL
jgi:hypothetical protein